MLLNFPTGVKVITRKEVKSSHSIQKKNNILKEQASQNVVTKAASCFVYCEYLKTSCFEIDLLKSKKEQIVNVQS